jgi:hypothetical protein
VVPRVPPRLLALAGIAGVCLGVVAALFPFDVPRRSDPGYLDVVFENGLVVLAARLVVLGAALVLLLGAVYVAASMVVRVRRGEWLRRAGPFEAELLGPREVLGHDLSSLLDALERAWRANDQLQRRLKGRDEELSAASEEVERLAAECARLKRRYS